MKEYYRQTHRVTHKLCLDSHWNKVYSHWNKVYSHWNKEKIFRTVKLSLWSLSKIWQTNRQTNIWTKTKKIDFQNSRLILELILNFYNFIQCNTIVQLTNYSVPRNNNNFKECLIIIIIIKMHAYLITSFIKL